MRTIDRFMEMLCGTFDNSEQYREEEVHGKVIHPRAKHVIGNCNEKMINLPVDFSGFFVIEESYFDLGDRQIAKHYLFSYEETEEGKIRLTSYDLPPDIPRDSLTNQATLVIDAAQITVSPRFEPLLLEERDGEFWGENVSRFSAETLFWFSLRVTPAGLFVKELLERDGSVIAGYEEPVVYRKLKA